MNKLIRIAVLVLIIIITTGIYWFFVRPATTNNSAIVSGVVPHHLLAKEIIEDFFFYISLKEKPETIVLLSPDHFNSASLIQAKTFITLEPGTKKFSQLAVNNELLQELTAKNPILGNNSMIVFDHGITGLLPFIKKYLPQTKILPIIIPVKISQDQIKNLIQSLADQTWEKIMVIASVDFSHNVSEKIAEIADSKSIDVLINFKEKEFKDLEVDCWQCLFGVRLFAHLQHQESWHIIAHKNSADFLNFESEQTTSYFSVIFKKN